ncbi:peptidoglycan recognition protein family protein [Streptomyces sp. NPDC002073]|uniref:peptidoglycan recognition protein family protein n=1 Tax=Streptomyces sp. NBC_00239 TaxID=2903640 RepID=UPI002E2E0937|nr:peptidoglycan recognition protein [Streptomyces sp. NBC_00239]
MRGFLASSIGVATAAALALPLALPTPSQAAAAPVAPAGSTQSLPLVPLGPVAGRAARVPGTWAAPRAPEAQGLAAREVKTFSMVGVVWDDAATELHGRVQVRTRSARTAAWSDWQDVETHNLEHAADPDAAERASGRVRGSTAPLWVGESDGIEVRVQAEPGVGDRAGGPTTVHHLPSGMRIELVDPGDRTRTPAEDAKGRGDTWAGGGGWGSWAYGDGDDGDDGDGDGDDKGTTPLLPGMSMAAAEASYANVPLAPLGATEITAQNKADSTADANVLLDEQLSPGARPYIGPRPRIVTRRGWGADESLRESGFVYTNTIKAAFVHHSASGNNYECSEAPAVLRSLYRYHVVSSGWRDFGYNFAVDKCGNVYEGRAGGVAKAVLGAHTMGFNGNSMGVAVLGSYTNTNPPAAAVDAVARLTAWKLGLYGANPLAKTTLKSGGGNLYAKGSNVSMNVISGHRDGFATECPGRKLYGKLGSTRTTSARLQGR